MNILLPHASYLYVLTRAAKKKRFPWGFLESRHTHKNIYLTPKATLHKVHCFDVKNTGPQNFFTDNDNISRKM